jgi:peptide-methionine (S)-S-oxide reductase
MLLDGEKKAERAAFGAGCFWQVEEAFRHLKGVNNTCVGYMGGHMPKPTYEKVCGGGTGHAETVEIVYNPDEISYRELLVKFWEIHDPTTPNRQGPDVGEQYRSVIFYYTPKQKKEAEAAIKTLDKSAKFPGRIVTQILPAETFWPAEDYHQRYLEKQGKVV